LVTCNGTIGTNGRTGGTQTIYAGVTGVTGPRVTLVDLLVTIIVDAITHLSGGIAWDTHIGIAGIANIVTVEINLVFVGQLRAIVADVTDAILVSIFLTRVGDGRTIVFGNADAVFIFIAAGQRVAPSNIVTNGRTHGPGRQGAHIEAQAQGDVISHVRDTVVIVVDIPPVSAGQSVAKLSTAPSRSAHPRSTFAVLGHLPPSEKTVLGIITEERQLRRRLFGVVPIVKLKNSAGNAIAGPGEVVIVTPFEIEVAVNVMKEGHRVDSTIPGIGEGVALGEDVAVQRCHQIDLKIAHLVLARHAIAHRIGVGRTVYPRLREPATCDLAPAYGA